MRSLPQGRASIRSAPVRQCRHTPLLMSAKLFLLVALLGAAVSAHAAAAKANWLTNCSECHGKDGRGRTGEGKKLKITDLTNPTVQASFTDAQAFKVIKHGLKDDRGDVMHSTSYRLTDDEIAALVKHVRSLKRR
ncbi:MAG: cytochrome C [Opitutus sp.]|nr:cytochrome C [Opitutus sp.]